MNVVLDTIQLKFSAEDTILMNICTIKEPLVYDYAGSGKKVKTEAHKHNDFETKSRFFLLSQTL